MNNYRVRKYERHRAVYPPPRRTVLRNNLRELKREIERSPRNEPTRLNSNGLGANFRQTFFQPYKIHGSRSQPRIPCHGSPTARYVCQCLLCADDSKTSKEISAERFIARSRVSFLVTGVRGTSCRRTHPSLENRSSNSAERFARDSSVTRASSSPFVRRS